MAKQLKKKTGNAKKKSTEEGARASNRNGASHEPRITGDLLSSSLLAYLRQWNAYGYELVQELGKAGMENFDSTTVYRTLRQLEKAGLVSSFWDTSESGPARRRYAITQAGEAFLELCLDMFGRYQKILQSALNSLDNFGERALRGPDNSQNGPEARRRRSNGGK